MSEEIKIAVTLTKGDIARYNFHHIRWIIILDMLGFILLMLGVYFSVASPLAGVRHTLSTFVIWGAVILAVGLSQPFILFLQIYMFKSPVVEAQMASRTYCFDDNGIHIHSGDKVATTPWSRVIVLKDIGRMFLIYTSPKLAYVIPKRYIPSKEERKKFVAGLLGKLKEAAQFRSMA
jgi:hypothetical protein